MNEIKPIKSFCTWIEGRGDQFVMMNREVRQLEADYKKAIKALEEANDVICRLCIRLNPQHKDCTSCNDIEDTREPIEKAYGISWEEIKEKKS